MKNIKGLGRLLTDGKDTYIIGSKKIFHDTDSFIKAVKIGFDLIITEGNIEETEVINVKYKKGTYEQAEWPDGTFIEYSHFPNIKDKIRKVGKIGHCWKVKIQNKEFIFKCLPF